MGRTPPGVRGLKFATDGTWADIMPSHPTRGAWIEIGYKIRAKLIYLRRTPPGVRGLK